ncbi:hypothetical protein [Polyangium sp. 15x6]|uniref:hypothetical protein n=1 Tax=Polyangium sp. 15x6 TaxID=3042687 RepID=UPI002499C495|nr:hypothetical protein [Polyangium sp. 15x6]MDI3285182.1 hypothetical protein [Polyangium sp. 15x6]
MSTRALVGHYTEERAWRAVWVHYDGAPEELGARLCRAVQLSGGDSALVLEHVFSTNGWSSWPDRPHHPLDPDDQVLTSAKGDADFDWYYLFSRVDRRLDVIPAGKKGLEPKWQVRFGVDGRPSHALGVSDLQLADLRSVRDAWERRCREPLSGVLSGLLDDLGLPLGHIGLGTEPAGGPSMRELHVGARIIHLETMGSEGRQEFCAGGRRIPFPSPSAWFEKHGGHLQGIGEALGAELELYGEDELFCFRRVVESVEDEKREMGLEEAHQLDPEAVVGNSIGELVARRHVVWRWLFDEAWKNATGLATRP